jgi:hypothetical protein
MLLFLVNCITKLKSGNGIHGVLPRQSKGAFAAFEHPEVNCSLLILWLQKNKAQEYWFTA